MTTIKKKDFVSLTYTGKLEDGTVFDTTEKSQHEHNHAGGPITICIGENYILKAIDDFLEGKETAKTYTLTLTPQQAFGKKNVKLLKMIPASAFKKQQINPIPGLHVNIDGLFGIVKTAAGGRIVVDFNHPLAGKAITYDFAVQDIVAKTEEKIRAVLKYELGIRDNEFTFKEGALTLKTRQDIPEQAKEQLQKRLAELIPEIKQLDLKKVE